MLTYRFQKELLKLKSKNNGKVFKPIPDNWYEFACLCDIRSGSEIKKFIPYEYQKQIINCVENNQTTIIAKTRQLGITEVISNYFLFKAVKNPGYLAVILSMNQASTMNIAKRLRRQIESIYEYTETNSDSLTDISFVNGGRLLFRNSSQNGARGLESVSDVLIDECAFVDDIDAIYSAVLPATTMVGDNAKIIIVSTPNGQSGWYWEKLSSNNHGRNIVEVCNEIKNEFVSPLISWIDSVGWCKIILHWLAHPTFCVKKETYLEDLKTKFQLSEDMINQEYNLSFRNSNSAVFSIETIKKAATGSWENHSDNSIYFMGLDTSTVGEDYTVLTVLKQVGYKYHLVYMYRENKLSYHEHIRNINNIINNYNPLYMAIEVNSSGQIFYEELSSKHLNVEFKIVKTTSSSKPKMIERLSMFLEDNLLVIPNDSTVIDELQSFSRNGNKLEAINGKHDDIVMSLAFAISHIC